jgi:hypothetical protein
MVSEWFGRAEQAPGGIHSDLLMTQGLQFCIYKYVLMAKGLRGRIYKPNFSVCLTHERRRAEPAMEDFEISHPENRARPAVALLFASASIISCLSSFWARRTPLMMVKITVSRLRRSGMFLACVPSPAGLGYVW